jgi:hypothetical protein
MRLPPYTEKDYHLPTSEYLAAQAVGKTIGEGLVLLGMACPPLGIVMLAGAALAVLAGGGEKDDGKKQ